MLEFVARRVWYALLWFMRRPVLKRMRQNWVHHVPESRRDKAWERFRRQERWARRYGLTIIRFVVLLMTGVVFTQLVMAWVYWESAKGTFSAEQYLR